VGEALVAKSQYAAAREAFENGIALDRALLAKADDAADMEYGISQGQLGIGKILNQQGDRAGALRSLEQSLQIRKRQAVARPGNSAAERGVAEVMHELANTPGSKVGWSDFRAQVEGMDARNILWPADRAWLEEARAHSTPGGKP
jgi:tetratricopeptide (TPR) repeat protein